MDNISYFLFVLVIHYCLGDDNCLGSGWENAAKSDTHCYMITTQEYRPSKAQDYCVSIGGNLVSIHSQSENELVEIIMNDRKCEYIYIGMHRSNSGSWEWYDGTEVDYENWNDNAGDADLFAYMHAGKWYHYDTEGYESIVCKKRFDPSPTTAVPTTTAPQPQVGCGHFRRDGCPDHPPSSIILESSVDNPRDCQHLCSGAFYEECLSFRFDDDGGKCFLYSTPIVDMADCQDVGGPNHPSLQDCVGCQDFYSSSCDKQNLTALMTFEGLGDLESCQLLCQENWKCREWALLNGTECKLYQNPPTCQTYNGPGKPGFDNCL